MVLCLATGGPTLSGLSMFLVTAHCLTTASEFAIVEAITARYGSRDVWRVAAIWLLYPNLWRLSLASVLVTIGFPGTSLFYAKFVFFVHLVGVTPGVAAGLGILFFALLPLFFVRLWAPM